MQKKKKYLPVGLTEADLMEGEILKPVKGYEGLYSISNYGGLYSHPKNHKPGKWIRQCNRVYRYIRLGLWKNRSCTWFSMHRMVAEAFLPNPGNKSSVNHIDGNKTNCRADNLQWVTHYQNIQHSADTGLNSHMRLSAQDKHSICESYLSGEKSYNELSIEYGTRESNIRRYVKNYPKMKEDLPLPVAA